MNSFDAAMSKIFGKDWKSTWAAYLTIASIGGGSVISYLATIPSPTHWQLKLVSILTAATAVSRVILGHMMQDGGTQLAFVPATGIVEAVPSHEVPNDPAAVAVTPPKP